MNRAMNCKECQPLFSELIEKALTPVAHEDVARHIAACPACRKDLRDFQRALAALRSVKLEAPPAGLKDAILASIEEAPAPLVVPAPVAIARERRPRTHRLVPAAAVLLFAAPLALLAFRERSWSGRVAVLEEDRDAKVEDASRERTRLLDDARKAAAAEGQRREALEQTTAGLDERFRSLEQESRRREEEVDRLEKELAAARGEGARLERELAVAREKPEPRMAEASAPERPRESVEAPQRRRNVVFKTRGGRLELSVRGPREEVLPELFAIARDDSSPEIADLSLHALESLLETPRKEHAAPPPQRGWIDRRLESFATALGMEDTTTEPPVPAQAERAARLKALEEAWRGSATSTQE